MLEHIREIKLESKHRLRALGKIMQLCSHLRTADRLWLQDAEQVGGEQTGKPEWIDFALNVTGWLIDNERKGKEERKIAVRGGKKVEKS